MLTRTQDKPSLIHRDNRDKYSAKSGLHFGQYEALVDFYSSLLLYYLFDRV